MNTRKIETKAWNIGRIVVNRDDVYVCGYVEETEKIKVRVGTNPKIRTLRLDRNTRGEYFTLDGKRQFLSTISGMWDDINKIGGTKTINDTEKKARQRALITSQIEEVHRARGAGNKRRSETDVVMEPLNSISSFRLQIIKEGQIPYNGYKVTSSNDARDIIEQLTQSVGLDCQAEEVFSIVTLDTKNHVTGYFEVSRGSLNASIVHPREVFKRALLQNASKIILTHNHPSGVTKPSKEDFDITRRLKEAGELLGITVLDHIIIGDDFYSFAANGDI